ncbi:hypothetical protein RO3G_15550 [Lichtheimia corymbifera JMRC:FSU:9682]|uniref:Large ribosomal subunit protein mL54 n=1 Tax=Lichtheimia corymbifera JMRC:FSU:9682 TaxID=1263082 RepID=A0A068S0G7_9FUNG|nr:hypothetical protein RO3G_15550 [Lichtheimia corymbifera JMRC:FSU:9682]
MFLQLARPLGIVRRVAPRIQCNFHYAAVIRNAEATSEKESVKPASSRPASSVPKGTVLKGINYLKDGKDPVALDDSEYPDWLWDLLDEKKQKQKTTRPSNRQYHRKKNREAIKAMNFMKDKKT